MKACPNELLLPDDKMVVQLSVAELRHLIADEVSAALQNGGGHLQEKDKLLTPTEAAEMLGQSVRWLYRHASRLPFTRADFLERIFDFQKRACGAGWPPETDNHGVDHHPCNEY